MEQMHNRLNSLNLDHFFVLEGGGPFGIGYEAGFLEAFRERGVTGNNLHAMGTSAGSWVAGMMATEKTFNDVADKEQIKLLNFKPHYMRGYAREVFGKDTHSEYVNATATEIGAHEPKLRIWNGAEHNLADMAAMSSSVPFLFAPAIYRNRLYLDGAVAGPSAGHANLAPRAKTLVCIAALATHLSAPGPFKYLAGPVLEKRSRSELRQWKARNPQSETIYIRPNRAINRMVKKPTDLFDFEIAKDVYWMAKDQAADLLDNEQENPKLIRLRQQLVKLLDQLAQAESLVV